MVLIIILTVICSILIYLYYAYRHKLYKDLIFICEYIKNDISFTKNNLNIILSKCLSKLSQSTKYVLKNYQNKDSKIIKKIDKENIEKLFTSLGVGDVEYENKNLIYFKDYFQTFEKEAYDDYKKKGLMYVKLSILLGLTICILIL